MQKIISLFARNYDVDRLVRDEVVPGAEWVIAGEGVATQKLDGTCCLVRDGKLYKRHEVKKGKKPPENFEPACEIDENTGKQQGWVAIGDGPEDKWHRQAWKNCIGHKGGDGTHELCGPKIQGNPEGFLTHHLLKHGIPVLGCSENADIPRDFDGLRKYFQSHDIEGIVWHHPDGRMVKLKGRDYGIERGKK